MLSHWVRVDQGTMALKEYSVFPKAPAVLKSRCQIVSIHIKDICWGVLSFYWDPVGVFYSPELTGPDKLWSLQMFLLLMFTRVYSVSLCVCGSVSIHVCVNVYIYIYIYIYTNGSQLNLRRIACPYKNIWAAVLWPPLCLWCCPHRPHWKSPAVPNFLLCRGCLALWTRGQLEEDWGLPPACTPRRIPPPHITFSRTEQKAVHHFTFLGSTITSDVKIDREVDNRLAMANRPSGRLYKRVWNSKHL